jgi:PBP1b-binding outer membrane lipoprotein LpoB
MNELQRVLINSGVVRFVADPGVREELMNEVKWQEEMAKGGGVSGDVAQGVSGADFMMMGTISSVVDQADKKAIVYYKVDLSLIDLRTWEKVWIGSAERKHLVEGAKVRY